MAIRNLISRKGLYLAILIVATGSVVGYTIWRGVRFKQNKENSSQKLEELVAIAEKSWRGNKFAPPADLPGIRSALELAINASTKTPDFHAPEAALRQAINDALAFFEGYSAKDYADFRKFRLPTPDYQASQARFDRLKTQLGALAPAADQGLPENPEDLFAYAWAKDAWCGKQYIEGIALSSIRVEFSTIAERPTYRDLKRILAKGAYTPIAGVESFHPAFIYPDQPIDVKSKTEGLYAVSTLADGTPSNWNIMTVVAVVKARQPDGPLPIIYRAYWSERSGRWLPSGLAVGSVYNRKWSPLF